MTGTVSIPLPTQSLVAADPANFLIPIKHFVLPSYYRGQTLRFLHFHVRNTSAKTLKLTK